MTRSKRGALIICVFMFYVYFVFLETIAAHVSIPLGFSF